MTLRLALVLAIALSLQGGSECFRVKRNKGTQAASLVHEQQKVHVETTSGETVTCTDEKLNGCTAHPLEWYQDDCSVHGSGYEYHGDWQACHGGFAGQYICKKKFTCPSGLVCDGGGCAATCAGHTCSYEFEKMDKVDTRINPSDDRCCKRKPVILSLNALCPADTFVINNAVVCQAAANKMGIVSHVIHNRLWSEGATAPFGCFYCGLPWCHQNRETLHFNTNHPARTSTWARSICTQRDDSWDAILGNGAWVPMHLIVGKMSYTEKIGTKKTEQTTMSGSWAAHVTTTLSAEMSGGVGFKLLASAQLKAGVSIEAGMRIELAGKHSWGWSEDTQREFSVTFDNGGFLWQWQYRIQMRNGEVLSTMTKDFALTAGAFETPKCFPGYMLDPPHYQKCTGPTLS